MNYVDKQYLSLAERIINTGYQSQDRTGTGTLSVFGETMKFDLNDGFPILTTKKVHLKSILGELLWFLEGSTSARSLKEEYGVSIWDEWSDENGSLGQIYGSQWRNWYSLTNNEFGLVKTKEDKYKDYKYPYVTTMYPQIECDLNNDSVWAIDKLADGYKVQFKSGYIHKVSREEWEASPTLEDSDNYRILSYMGFLGDLSNLKYSDREYSLWREMMMRCYDESHPEYEGLMGVTVSPIWHSFEMFVKTLPQVKLYTKFKSDKGYVLDKEYYGSNVYSPSTTIFLPSDVLYHSSITSNTLDNEKGVNQKVVSPQDDFVYRRLIVKDQIAELIDNIKKDPYSRRHIVSAWNVGELKEMALSPCHYSMQFYVRDGKLSCLFNMRSSDVFLGLPFNIASYALLTHMIAQVCDLEVGELIWVGGDVHIYTNHIKQIKEQLTREPRELPKLIMNKEVKDIDSFSMGDFSLEGYKPWPAIKGDVAF